MIVWKRKKRGPAFIRPDYLLYDAEKWTGIVVRHCNHPTSLRPYSIYGLREDDPEEGFFRYRLLSQAQEVASVIYQARGE